MSEAFSICTFSACDWRTPYVDPPTEEGDQILRDHLKTHTQLIINLYRAVHDLRLEN